LFHGCCVDVAEQAVRLGVLPGPRQEGRKAGSPVAFAASWPFVGRYVGPSAVRPGHVGCVLRVVGQSHSTQNPNYRQAAKFKVAAVMLRPWLFDLRKELGPRQSCASAIHKFDWGGAPTKPAAEPGSGPPRQATARGSDGQCSRSCLRHSRRPCRPAKREQSTELAAAPPRQAEARGSDGNRSRSPPRRSTMLRPPPLQSQQSQQSPESRATPRPRLRPKGRPPHESPQSPRPTLAPPLAAASEVPSMQTPRPTRSMPTPRPTLALPVAAASEVDDVCEEEETAEEEEQSLQSIADSRPTLALPIKRQSIEKWAHEKRIDVVMESMADPRPTVAQPCPKWSQPPPSTATPRPAPAPPRQQSPQSPQSMADARPTLAPPCQQSKRALRSPERPPKHLNRLRSCSGLRTAAAHVLASAPSTSSEQPPAHVLARAARTRESSTTAQMNNDWTCPTCGNVNWFRRGYCIGGRGQCLRPREATWLPGDWFCSCGNHNLARRTVCNRSKCTLSRVQGEIPRF
jgi:hypothetical protein